MPRCRDSFRLMAGTGRVMCPFDDPQHAWIEGVETVINEVTE